MTGSGAPRSTRRAARTLAALALLGVLQAGVVPARAQGNATVPGALTAYATLTSAGFEWRIAGDDDGDCFVGVEYRRAGAAAWRLAQPLVRVEHGLWTHGEDPGNLLAGSVFLLEPGSAYEARLTLADPDGGAEQRIIAFTTRAVPQATALRTLYVVPGSGGGSGTPTDPLRGLAAADAVARPGDLFLLQPGTYHGTFRVTRDGTATDPIAYRGADAASVILDGDGGTTGGSFAIDLTGRQYVIIESASLVNCLRPVCVNNSQGVTVRGCTIRPVNQLLSVQGIRAAASRDLYVADNTVLMTGQWATIGRTGAYGTGGYGILVEGTGHVIRHNTVVEAWDAISIPVTGTAVPAVITSNVDIADNLVDRASDDGVQADAVHHNVRITGNRLLNTGSAVSFQPAFGGPGYVLRNEAYNARIEPYKLHQETSYGWTQETSGFVVAHNTTVSSRNGWYESGIWRHGSLRDNLLLGARPGTYTLYMPYQYPLTSLDADGYNRVDGYANLIRFSGVTYPNLPAFFAGTGNEAHGREVTPADFERLVLPHDPQWNPADGYGWAYIDGDNDLRPAATGAAIDAGLALANLNDDYRGAAPDLGCYEYGSPPRIYGARTANAAPIASASADVTVGRAPLAVRFHADVDDADGHVVACRWTFGDGATVDDTRDVTHTFAAPGRYSAIVTVTDEDGGTATATVAVHATAYSDAGDAAVPAPMLARPWPNPSAGSVRIAFALPAPGDARLDVFDVRGARIRTLADGPFAAGPHELGWDARDAAGRPLSPGLYVVRLTTPAAGTREQRIVRVR